MGVRKWINLRVEQARDSYLGAASTLSDGLSDRDMLGQLMLGAGFLFSLVSVSLAIAPTNLPFLRVDGTPVALISVGLLVVGGILRSDFVGAAERATRRGVDIGEFRGGVYVGEGMTGELHVNYPEGYNPAQDVLAQQLARSAEGLRKQEAILREIYTLGLVQARLSFNLSMFFAGVGAALLFAGVGLAVFRAPTDGAEYASIVAALSGAVVTLTSALFFAQTNSTRKNMVSQAVHLREESQDDRRISTARELVVAVTEEATRNDLHADMARSLIDNLVGRPTEPRSTGAASA
ncbi:hypothetical protein [Actinoplanes sp. NPDC051494]|uniref:TRADD-N-associated membrane domain-containing protein n=1 Tax=Actinoplanes sp. NPDC051494 TaxID=3363907 RepID=UPI0037B22866